MTENYLRLGLLLIAAVIVMLILFEAWNKRRHLNLMKSLEIPSSNLDESNEPKFTEELDDNQSSQLSNQQQDTLMISVLAKPGRQFASYELLQAILAAGFKFGDMNLFHHYQQTADGETKLFSLAAATKSGEFDMDQMGDFACKGLILFMQLNENRNRTMNPQKVFNLMLRTAERLCDDLDGDLHADIHTPWNQKVYTQYQNIITESAGAVLA